MLWIVQDLKPPGAVDPILSSGHSFETVPQKSNSLNAHKLMIFRDSAHSTS